MISEMNRKYENGLISLKFFLKKCSFFSGSVDDWVNELKSLAKSQNVPCVFALNRFRLGRSARKNVPTSAFAVLNHDGIEVILD